MVIWCRQWLAKSIYLARLNDDQTRSAAIAAAVIAAATPSSSYIRVNDPGATTLFTESNLI